MRRLTSRLTTWPKVTPFPKPNGMPNWNARKSLARQQRQRARRSSRRKQRRGKYVRHRQKFQTRRIRQGRPTSLHNKPYVRLRTTFPEVLDFVSNTKQTVEFFNALKHKTLLDPADEVLVDLSALKTISPDAALVLIAEVTRSSRFGCKLKGNRATIQSVDQILWDVGYYSYYAVRGNEPPHTASKIFLVHQTGDRVDGRIAKELIDKFIPVASLKDNEAMALYDALVECMTNVLQHAYPERGMYESHLPYRWWLLGTLNPESHEISFCFYDQGVGIPATIRTRWIHSLPFASFFSKNDNELLIEAVLRGLSSTKLDTRGKGLPTLKGLIDHYKNGQMAIVTHKSKCIFATGIEPQTEVLDVELGGTLIHWTLSIDE